MDLSGRFINTGKWRYTIKLNLKHHGRYIKGAGGTRLFVEENGDPIRATLLFTVKQKEITQ